MGNKDNVIQQISDFLKSDKKGMLITGTHQYKKHKIVMGTINRLFSKKLILFRTNSMGMVEEHLEDLIKKQPKAGERVKLGKNAYEFDSFNSRPTWDKTSHDFSIVIVYPIDAIARGSVSMESIKELYDFKRFNKVFFVSWTDNKKNDYSLFDEYVDERCVYNADEDDPQYHERVIENINRFK